MNANMFAVDTGVEIEFVDDLKYNVVFAQFRKTLEDFANKNMNPKGVGNWLSKSPDRCIYYTACDVSEMLGVSVSQAYKIIQGLNKELEKKGFIVISGKVSKRFFNEKYYGLEPMMKM